MKIVITESQLKSIIEVSGRKSYPDLDLLSKDELTLIARNHFKKYRTLKNNTRLYNACIERGIDVESFRTVTNAKRYRLMSDDELIALARKYENITDLQQKNGVLYYELRKRDISKNLFKPFRRHQNDVIPNDIHVKKQKDRDDLDNDRRYDDEFMFTPITEQTSNLTVHEQTLLGFLSRFLKGEDGDFQNTPIEQLKKSLLFNSETIYPMVQKLLQKKTTGKKTYDDKTFNALLMAMNKTVNKDLRYELYIEGGKLDNVTYTAQY